MYFFFAKSEMNLGDCVIREKFPKTKMMLSWGFSLFLFFFVVDAMQFFRESGRARPLIGEKARRGAIKRGTKCATSSHYT